MEKRKLDSWEIENIEDLIPSVEEMFGIELPPDELIHVSDFDELCTLISNKIELPNVESCTKQQAFYKLRSVLNKLEITDKNSLTLNNSLEDVFPRESRKHLVKKIENELGFEIDLVEAPAFLTKTLLYGLLISFGLLVINFQIGLIGIFAFILGLVISNKLGNELRVETVRDLVELITRENYLKVRSTQGTINRSELKDLITSWFSDNLGVKNDELLNARFR